MEKLIVLLGRSGSAELHHRSAWLFVYTVFFGNVSPKKVSGAVSSKNFESVDVHIMVATDDGDCDS
eukprot:scaffold3607_cov43-Prasinocladus_malaysianus.AAC.1